MRNLGVPAHAPLDAIPNTASGEPSESAADPEKNTQKRGRSIANFGREMWGRNNRYTVGKTSCEREETKTKVRQGLEQGQ